jgi:hypothetical protein
VETDATEPIRQALGDIVIAHGRLTDVIAWFATELIGQGEEIGAILTAPLSYKVLLDITSALFEHRAAGRSDLAEASAAFKRAMVAAQRANEGRDRLLHSSWLLNLTARPSPEFIRAKSKVRRTGLERDLDLKPLDAIRGICAELNEAADEVFHLRRRPEIRRLLGK